MSGALRAFTIGLTAFLTVVDLFATQAILPSLTIAYGTTPAAMGFAVGACTIGMAAGSLLVAVLGRGIDRRRGILLSLALLSLPTLLLATMPPLPIFTGLRVVQGLCMSTAFALTLAYLGEQTSAAGTAGAFAAYITGNVASNLLGRLLAAGVVDHLGLAANFYIFAGLNVAGALLVWFTIDRAQTKAELEAAGGPSLASLLGQLRSRALISSCAIGFLILFAFIGIFSYVNFVLVRPPFGLGMMMLGTVYFVFLPSIVTTPFAGKVATRFGTRITLWSSFGLAAAGLPMLLSQVLGVLLAGLALFAVGTFFAQATVTSFASRVATSNRGEASGLYLACYYLGGLVGSAAVGQVFDHVGWTACVVSIGVSLALAMLLSARLRIAQGHRSDAATTFQLGRAQVQGGRTR